MKALQSAPDDWAIDFDHTHPDYASRAPEIWNDLRTRCSMAHTERFGGTWLPTRHDDIAAIARDTEHFSSRGVIVTETRPQIPAPVGYAPPITSDPPFHAGARQVLIPGFSPHAVEKRQQRIREICDEQLDTLLFGDTNVVDAAAGYAQNIPVLVIADILGVPREDGDRFRVFIHRMLEPPGHHKPTDPADSLNDYLLSAIADRRANPTDDLISELVAADIDGEPLTDHHIRGTIGLLLFAGIDSTWSAIGASLWHLAQHPDHRRRWRNDPAVRPFAIEELLRFYAPVTMARIVSKAVTVRGRLLQPGDWVLLPFPAANRDPEAIERADEFIIDRAINRHAAFGLGIHRCLGSNLARLELAIAIEHWMERIPHFELADADAVRWSAGQVRGPRTLPIRIDSDHPTP